MLIYLT